MSDLFVIAPSIKKNNHGNVPKSNLIKNKNDKKYFYGSFLFFLIKKEINVFNSEKQKINNNDF